MAVSTLPAGGVSLRGLSADMDDTTHSSKSAILFKLSQSMLNDLRAASNGKDGLHLVTGKVPVRLSSESLNGSVHAETLSRNSVWEIDLWTSVSPPMPSETNSTPPPPLMNSTSTLSSPTERLLLPPRPPSPTLPEQMPPLQPYRTAWSRTRRKRRQSLHSSPTTFSRSTKTDLMRQGNKSVVVCWA